MDENDDTPIVDELEETLREVFDHINIAQILICGLITNPSVYGLPMACINAPFSDWTSVEEFTTIHKIVKEQGEQLLSLQRIIDDHAFRVYR